MQVRAVESPVTFQHAEVHGVIGSLWHTEHHLQAIFNLPLPFLAAREQLLQKTNIVSEEGPQNVLPTIRIYENSWSSRQKQTG